MEITMEQVRKLRELTGAGVMDCKRALQEKNGDIETAAKYLREKGIAAAVKKTTRSAKEGLVSSYIHMGVKIGVLIEVNCETDFVAKTDNFKELVHNLALQVAAAKPLYISREDVEAEVIENERSILRAQALNEKKPENIVDKIVDGRIEKYFAENCLMEQNYIRDTDLVIKDLIMESIAQLGENIVVSRFTRYEVGEGIEGEC